MCIRDRFTTEYFGPAHADEFIDDGLMVAISYGGSPKVTPVFGTEFKANVPVVWDVGSLDPAWTTTSQYGVKAGESWYRNNGFVTELNVVTGEDHSRSGQFGPIMDRAVSYTHLRAHETPE